MTKFSQTISALGVILVMISCQNPTTLKWEETMKVHDEVMLKMQVTSDLESKLDKLILHAEADTLTVLYTKIDQLKGAHLFLGEVNEEMMDWMASIQKPRKGDNQDSIINYLETEQKAIIEVGVHMDEAVNQAQNLLKSLEK